MVERASIQKLALPLFMMFLGGLFLPLYGWAQGNPGQPGSNEKTTQAADTSAPSDQSRSGQNQTDSNSTADYTSMLGDGTQTLASQMPIRQVGGPGSLSPEGSPLHLGPIYDTMFSMFYVVGNGLVVNTTTNQISTQINNAGVLRTTLVYDHLVRRNRLALQYSPEMVIINGRVQQNLSNQTVSLDTVYLLSSRWSVWLGNVFNTQSGALISDDPTLQVDTESGQTAQSAFLQNSNQYISDRTQAEFRYVVGPRDTLNIMPTFQYEHTKLNTLPTSSYTTSGTLEWNHALTRTQSAGLYYAESYHTFSRLLPSTLSTSFGVGYAYAFAPTWQVTVSGGANTVGATGGRVWSYTGSVGLYKGFHRSSAALVYYRGMENGPFLSDRVGDEVSLGYSIHLMRRLQIGANASYQDGHTSDPSVGKTTGTYLTGDASWQLTRRMVSFVSYGRRQTHGNDVDVLTGEHFAVSAGIRWEAHRNTAY